MSTLDLDFLRQSTIPSISGALIKPSPIHGFGLFAEQLFRAREMLCRLDGQLLEISEYLAITTSYNENKGDDKLKNLLIECNKINGRILARAYRTHYSFINHSTEPNADLTKKEGGPLVLRALKDIQEGEEILIDYRQ